MCIMNSKKQRYAIDIVFIICLFLLFAFSAVIVILFGIKIYSHTVSLMNVNYSSRTSAAYITEKIRQSDSCGAIYTDTSNGCERLVMAQDINGEVYATSLYEYNGYLYELFSKTDICLSPDAGQPVVSLSGLSFEFISPSLLCVQYNDEFGKDTTLYISLHCGDCGGKK